MTVRTSIATFALSFALASRTFAGGHRNNHQNLRHVFKGGTFSSSDERLFNGIGKDEPNDFFTDAKVAKPKSSHVTWANSGPDCLVAPIQASGSIDNSKASKPNGFFHRVKSVIWANSGPDCLVAPFQSAGSIARDRASKPARQEKSIR